MDANTFKKTMQELLGSCEAIMTDRRPAYTRGNVDVLANFKNVAGNVGLSPKQVWSVYFMKHVDSLMSYVQNGIESSEPIDRRVADAINYLILFVALDRDERMQREATK